jgi:hypothetical protein
MIIRIQAPTEIYRQVLLQEVNRVSSRTMDTYYADIGETTGAGCESVVKG